MLTPNGVFLFIFYKQANLEENLFEMLGKQYY